MIFQHDPKKEAKSIKKHGITFEEAETVFEDPLAQDYYDPEHSKKEHRYLIKGASLTGQLLMVSYTYREDQIRIISSRKLDKSERKKYESTLRH